MKKTMSKNIMLNVTYTLLNGLFPMIASMYIARILLKDDVGRVAYAQNIVSYFITFAALGLPKYGIREISRFVTDREKQDRTFSELFFINLISTVIFSLGYFLMVFNIPSFHRQFWLYFAVALPLLANGLNLDWYYIGNENYTYITGCNIVVKILCLGAMLFFVRDASDCIIYAVIYSLSTAGYYVLIAAKIFKSVRISFRGISPKRHLMPVFILLCSVVANDLYTKVDTTMLGIWGTDADVAVYTNAVHITRALCMLTSAISTTALPRLSLYHVEKKKNEFGNLVSHTYEIVLLVVAPCLIGLILVPEMIVTLLFGTPYLPAAGVLRILAPLVLIISSCCICGQMVLLATNGEKYQLFAMLAGAIINIVLNAVMIPHYGMYGAAIASVISEFLVLLLYLYHAKKSYTLRFEKNFLLSLIVSCICVCAAIVLIKTILGNSTFCLLICCLTGFAIYVSVLLVTGNPVLRKLVRGLKKKP